MTNGSMSVPVQACMVVPARRPRRPLTLAIVVEADGVAAQPEAVDVRPGHLERRQRLQEGPPEKLPKR